MDDDTPRLVYNPDDGSVDLRLGAQTVTVDGIVGDVAFERMMPDGESANALWLGRNEADVLAKMIRHVLGNIKIRSESEKSLRDLLPRVEALTEGRSDGS
ncbi:MAG: hypothetical protein IT305_17375 [Chloroflexi bacterium]|nr:hypothetical protein [Chloroflexota bacterium]